MNHADIRAQMADYLDGDLHLEARALFDAHLDQCGECSGELAEMRATIKLLRSLPDPEPPAFLIDNVMRQIREGEARPSFGQRVGEWIAQLFTPQFAVPATALAAGIAVFVATGNLPVGIGDSSEAPAPARVAGTRSPSNALRGQPVTVASEQRSAESPSIQIAEQGAGGNPTGRYLERVAGGATLGPITRPYSGSVLSFGPRRVVLGPMLGGDPAAPRSGWQTASSAPALGLGGGVYAPNFSPVARSGPAASGPAGVTREDRRSQRLDAGLAALRNNPTGFSREFSANHTLAEQELWLEQLAAQAVATGQSEEVERALRESGDVASEQLASQFAEAVALERANAASQTATATSDAVE